MSVSELSVAMTGYTVMDYTGDKLNLRGDAECIGTTALVPDGSEIYSNDIIIKTPGPMSFRVRGSGADELTAAVTGNGADIPFEIKQNANELLVTFELTEYTGDLRITLANDTGSEVSVDSLTLIRNSAQKIATLPKVAGVGVVIS